MDRHWDLGWTGVGIWMSKIRDLGWTGVGIWDGQDEQALGWTRIRIWDGQGSGLSNKSSSRLDSPAVCCYTEHVYTGYFLYYRSHSS